jgi:putative glycosyltransferase (TIGR04372 family)
MSDGSATATGRPGAQQASAPVPIGSLEALLKLVVEHNLCLASNVYYGSIGHMALEMDFLARARRQGATPGGRSCLVTLPEEPFSKAFAFHYPDLLAPYAVSNRVWGWAREIIRALPELSFNIGVSHMAVDRPVADPGHRPIMWQGRLEFMLSHRGFRERTKRNYVLRSATSDWYPFRRTLDPSPSLRRFLEGLGDRPLVLLHLKQTRINASAGPTDPAGYLPTLAHVRDLGWQPVLVGREAMPDAFRAYGVADYAGSGLATQADDLALISRARAAITGGSGIAHAFEIMDLPLVYTNSWHIDLQCSARRSIVVPTTMRERSTGRPLTIREHIAVHHAMPDGAFYGFPHGAYIAEPPSAEHIRAAFEEVLTLGPPGTEPPPPNALQQRFSRIDPDSAFAAGKARVAAAWAEAFESRFGDKP